MPVGLNATVKALTPESYGSRGGDSVHETPFTDAAPGPSDPAPEG